jgi:hypothetical protein
LGNGISLSGALMGTNAKSGGFYTDINNKFIANGTLVIGAKYSF